jgi:hypothetical protein
MAAVLWNRNRKRSNRNFLPYRNALRLFYTYSFLLKNRTKYCLDPESEPAPEPEPKLFQSRNRNSNKSLRFHNTKWH